MGTTLRDVIFDVGGGVPDGKAFKAVQIGGPSGGCIPAALLDTPSTTRASPRPARSWAPAAWSSWTRAPAWSTWPATSCDFTQDESCGKCMPCRVGTKRMLEILERITAGEGQDGDIERLEELATHDQEDAASAASARRRRTPCSRRSATSATSTRPTSTRSAARPASATRSSPTRSTPSLCTGCTLCAKKCPVDADRGDEEAGAPHRPVALRALRLVPGRLPLRRRQGGQRTRADRRASCVSRPAG